MILSFDYANNEYELLFDENELSKYDYFLKKIIDKYNIKNYGEVIYVPSQGNIIRNVLEDVQNLNITISREEFGIHTEVGLAALFDAKKHSLNTEWIVLYLYKIFFVEEKAK